MKNWKMKKIPDFINSIHGHQTNEFSLQRGDRVWWLVVSPEIDKVEIKSCRVLYRSDRRNGPNDWTIMYEVARPEIIGLKVLWVASRVETTVLFESREDAIIAAEFYLRSRLEEDLDTVENAIRDDDRWDGDYNTGCAAN